MSAPAKPWAAMTADEKARAVKPLFLAGESYGKISDLLGVIMRLRKLGELPPARSRQAMGAEATVVARAKVKKAVRAEEKPRKAKTSSGLDAVNIAVRVEHRAEAVGLPASRALAFKPLIGRQPVAFPENRGCSWPVDGLEGSGLLVCGAEVAFPLSPYCADHRRLAYLPLSVRQKAALRAAERLS